MDALVLLSGVALCAGVLALVLLSGSAMPDALACAKVRVPGGREPAFRARYATGAARGIGVLPVVVLVVAGVGLASGVGDPSTRLRVVGGAVAAAAALAFAYRARGGATRHYFVAITPSGLLLRPNHLRVFVPWEAVDDVVMLGTASETGLLGVLLRDQDAIGAGALDRLHLRLRRPKKVDLAVRLDDMDTEPRTLVHALWQYLDHPHRRPAIGSPAELRHLQSIQARDL